MALSKQDTLQALLLGYAPLALIAFFGLPQLLTRFFYEHPFELIVGTFALPILGLVVTEPDSLLRLIIVPLVTLGAASYHKTAPFFMPNGANASAYDGPFMLLFLTTVDVFLLRRVRLGRKRDGQLEFLGERELNGQAAEFKEPKGVSTFTTIGRAAHAIFSYRAIGTSREAKNIPWFSSENPRHVPSRLAFLFKRALASFGAFLVVDYLGHQPPPPPEQFAASKASLFLARSNLTVETITTRIFSTALFWTMLYITIGLIYNATSFFGVLSFLTDPADWPPYFGSALETFTLRKFWAVFWHSGLRNPLLSAANFFTDDILRLRKGTLAARYVRIFATFGLSGIVHTLVDTTAGINPKGNTAMTLFIMQAVGITIEDFVEWLYRSSELGRTPPKADEKKFGKGGVERPKAWQAVVGYVWVAAWLVWTTPAWSYQNIRHDAGQLFPFSLVEAIKG